MSNPNIPIVGRQRGKKKKNNNKPSTVAFWKDIHTSLAPRAYVNPCQLPVAPLVRPNLIPVKNETSIIQQTPKFRPITAVIDLCDDTSPTIPGQTGNTSINMPTTSQKISINTNAKTANTPGQKKNLPQETISIDMFSDSKPEINKPGDKQTNPNTAKTPLGNNKNKNQPEILVTTVFCKERNPNVRVLADVPITDDKMNQPGSMQSKKGSNVALNTTTQPMNQPQGSNVKILANVAIKSPDRVKQFESVPDTTTLGGTNIKTVMNQGKKQLNINAPSNPGKNNPVKPGLTQQKQTKSMNRLRMIQRIKEKQAKKVAKVMQMYKAKQANAAKQKAILTVPLFNERLEEYYAKMSATQKPSQVEESTATATTAAEKPVSQKTQGSVAAPVNKPVTSQAPTMTPRSSAGSFFTTTQPSPAKTTGGPVPGFETYKYKFPKGIPKSFLPQNPTQETGTAEIYDRDKGGFMPFINYRAGIPRSFLRAETNKTTQEIATPQMKAVDPPMWQDDPMYYPQNTPTLDPSSSYVLSQTPPLPDTGTGPVFIQTENPVDIQQQYSPSDIYAEQVSNAGEDSQSSELSQGAQKRLSAFHRLGPVSQPKKPKLTINLTLNKEQPVREVVNEVDDDPERYAPVHLRQNIIMSTDETVMKYLTSWPWRKNVAIRRSATARHSRSVMILEQEHMEEAYERDNVFIQISVKGYPSSWTKERVLDAILDTVKGHSLIPCFTEFTQHECKFLTLRTRSALIILHKTGFYIHKDGVELAITIAQTDLSLNQIDFIPRLILRKRVAMAYENDKLNLKAFTLQDDISYFIYFPLNRVCNQTELLQLHGVVPFENLLELDLSHNRLTKISGLELTTKTPRLRTLNLSHNYLDKITELIGYRGLPLKKIYLEGNPLCHNYIDSEHYVRVIRMLFSTIVEIDGVQIQRKYELPQIKQNHCPDEAREVAEKFLEVYFPLLDAVSDHRSLIQDMYDDDATLTITYCYKLRYGPIYRCFRNLFLYARFLDEGETDSVVGSIAITKLINRWPQTSHDPYSFTVDVMYHTETTTILRISGVLKLTAETLAEDEHLLTFTRTVVLFSEEGDEYKIQNEMVYWDVPTPETAKSAFRINTIPHKKIELKIEATTDEDLREKYLQIFMKLTSMDKKISSRCLEMNSWNFKLALEHFTKLLKTHNLHTLYQTPTKVTAN